MKDKILFVDDDATLLKFVSEYFQDHPYEILIAHSGQEAHPAGLPGAPCAGGTGCDDARDGWLGDLRAAAGNV